MWAKKKKYIYINIKSTLYMVLIEMREEGIKRWIKGKEGMVKAVFV